ncbi:sensor histidine kinase [Leptolyngbya sp. FACHB-36]|uniref:sensor histidine kinase n=1 Tax=Leptolyngbya sp. FACHB-36 TaxID=2692808 RepID=UPI00168096AE|nr:sensor histidine kinase [Leptolyngbya sp. FACHB-36]MBD2019062.1 sensor histidine kinase [Leptolyngbya sp. FACHB-36]
MTLVSSASPSIRKILRYMELFFITTYLCTELINSVYGIAGRTLLQKVALLSVYLVLSYLFPVRAALWIRQTYIASGILAALLANSQGFEFDFFLYLYIVKGCFLLDRKFALFTAGASVVAAILVAVWSMPTIVHVEPFWVLDPSQSRHVLQFATGALYSHLTASAFIIPLSFAIIGEQTSRHRAEKLAQQVEDLVTALERSRIARDIHDSLGHTLTALRIHLSLAQKALQDGNSEALQAVNTAKLLANQSIEEVQQTVQTLRRPQFDLNQAIAELIEQRLPNLASTLDCDINFPVLSPQISHHLYCIIREGLINIQKHAEASSVQLRGHATADEVLLELQDNGRGFELHQTQSGFGLTGIVERVTLLGGTLKIDSAVGNGTQIHIVIPR